MYAGLIVDYSLRIIYVHIWCRLGLPSTVLVFIIVLWPIPGVYINQPVCGYDWALVVLLHVTSSVVNVCLLGELIGDR